MKLKIAESPYNRKRNEILTVFDIPISMKLDVTEIMFDKGYEMIANYNEEITFQKTINGVVYKVSFEPNKHINNRQNEKLFSKILALKE